MYCGKCGKEIKDNSKFCPYCGDKNMTQVNSSVGKAVELPSGNFSVKIVFSIIPLILVSILMFRFYSFALSRIDANMDAFDWVNNSAKTIGVIFHWGIPIMLSSVCIEYIVKCVSSKMNVNMVACIKVSTNLFIYGTFLWLGRTICNDWSSSNDMSIVLYRIFSTYKELIGMTMLFGLIVLICGILIGKRTEN